MQAAYYGHLFPIAYLDKIINGDLFLSIMVRMDEQSAGIEIPTGFFVQGYHDMKRDFTTGLNDYFLGFQGCCHAGALRFDAFNRDGFLG